MPITTLTASSAAVAMPHLLAAKAAREMLASGANAVDAAVAGALVTLVVQPFQVSVGGYGGVMVVHQSAKRRTLSIDFDSRAPVAFKAELYADPAKAQHGPLAVSVPGVIAGLDRAVRELGTKSFSEACAPAIAVAEEGFAVDATLKRVMDELVKLGDPVSVRAMLPEGAAVPAGQKWVQKDLAALLRRIAPDPRAFYTGEIPRAICKRVQELGGILSEEDFQVYQPSVGEAVSIDYRGYTLFTPPPPAGGLTALSILKTLEEFDLSQMPQWGANFFALFGEATKACWAERREFLGDPEFVNVPMQRLLSSDAAKERADRIRQRQKPTGAPLDPAKHTVNIVAIDGDRTLVSLTLTQGDTWGSRLAIPGLGVILGHGMSRFTYGKANPNSPAPRKRLQHNMCPTVILKDARPYAAIGLPGGTRIVTVTAQLACSLIDFKAAPAQALTAPRVHTEGADPLLLSPSVPKAVADELERMGHPVRRNQGIGGAANVAVLSSDQQQIQIASGYGDGSVVIK